jgi:UDP-GlcNAc:undecaprenyl-phosphate/decaprenyl-phosphate GlcNAc-1-phosphate transferase
MSTNLIYFFTISLAVSALVHLILIRIAHKRGVFIDDHESDLPQKIHDSPTPRVGGVGIFMACILFMVDNKLGVILFGASVPAFLAGLFEDLFSNMSPKNRLLIMVFSSGLAIYYADAIITDYGIFTTPTYVGIIVSFVAILGLINGTNLIDGFNGLLSGTSLIIFSAFAYVTYRVGDFQLFQINLVIVAALIGFLAFNYPKGKIFMGDGGAYFIGFVMAVISMLIVKRNTEVNPFFVFACILYPVIEVIFSFVRRGLIEKTNPLEPDNKHLHLFIFRSLAKHENYKTIYFIAICNIVAAINYNNIWVLIITSLAFISIYLLTYYKLAKHASV